MISIIITSIQCNTWKVSQRNQEREIKGLYIENEKLKKHYLPMTRYATLKTQKISEKFY